MSYKAADIAKRRAERQKELASQPISQTTSQPVASTSQGYSGRYTEADIAKRRAERQQASQARNDALNMLMTRNQMNTALGGVPQIGSMQPPEPAASTLAPVRAAQAQRQARQQQNDWVAQAAQFANQRMQNADTSRPIPEPQPYRPNERPSLGQNVMANLLQGSGLTSLVEAAENTILKDDKDLPQNYISNILNQTAQRGQEDAPAVATAGNIAGGVGALTAIGAVTGGAGSALGVPANLGTRAMRSAITFGIHRAANEAGALTGGRVSGEKYGRDILRSGISGAAGSVASGLVNSGISKVLVDKKLMTPFMEYVRNLGSSTAFSVANTGAEYALTEEEERPSSDQIARQLATSFLYNALMSGIETWQATDAAKARARAQAEQLQRELDALTRGSFSAEGYADRVNAITQRINEFRNSLNSTYYAGGQEYVNNMNSALDAMEDMLAQNVARYASAPSGAAPSVPLLGAAGDGFAAPAVNVSSPQAPAPVGAPESQSEIDTLTVELENAINEGFQSQLSDGDYIDFDDNSLVDYRDYEEDLPATVAPTEPTVPTTETAVPTTESAVPTTAPTEVLNEGFEDPGEINDPLMQLAMDTVTGNDAQKEAQRRSIMDAAKVNPEGLREVVDRATMLTADEKSAAITDGLIEKNQEDLAALMMEVEDGRKETGEIIQRPEGERPMGFSSGERAGGVPQTGGVSEATSGDLARAAADRESKSLRYHEAHQAREIISEAEPGQVIYRIKEGTTPSIQKAEAQLRAYGVTNIVSFASPKPIRVKTGESARAFTDPRTRTIGFRVNDERVESDKLVRHELVELGIMDGKIDRDTALRDIAGRISSSGMDGLNLIIQLYSKPERLYDPKTTEAEREKLIDSGAKEMLCDAGGGINQFKGLEGYEDLANLMDYIIENAQPYLNEKLGGVFDAEPEINEGFSAEGLTEAVAALDENGIAVADGAAVQYSYDTWIDTDKEELLEDLVNAGFDEDEAQKWIDDVSSVSAIIARNPNLNYKAGRGTWLKPNAETVKSLDGSFLCPKKSLFQGTYNAIAAKNPNITLDAEQYIKLKNLLRSKGYEVPCVYCYNESRVQQIGTYAKEFVEQHKDWKVTSRDLTTTDGLAKLEKNRPDVYREWLKYRQTGHGLQRSVKFEANNIAYTRDDIMNMSAEDRRAIMAEGGLRWFAFSDFKTEQLIDAMQAVLDLSAMNMRSYGYTKQPDFVRVFGNTGIMINMSVAGELKDGKLVFDSTDGMDIDTALALRESHPKTAGLTLVGINDEHILAAMADPRIDMIIPFHRSGLSNQDMRDLGISHYTDYQTRGSQNEHWVSDGKTVGKNLLLSDYWDNTKSGKENAERYLRECRRTGRIPKFREFLDRHEDSKGRQYYTLKADGSTDGYWKLLVDFKMYDNDGNNIIQQEVRPNFDMDAAREILESYEGSADKLPVARDVVREFLKEQGTKAEKDNEFVTPETGENVQYSVRLEPPPKKTGKAYKVFLLKDGKLYPPMVANPGGEDTPDGVWLNADIGQAAPASKTGRPQVQAGGKGTATGKSSLAFRPGWHLGEVPLAKQFARTNPETGVKDLFPANFVWAECEYAMDHDYQDEAMSYGYTENGKFRHSYAGLPALPKDGYYKYRTNPNPDTVPWVITGAMKVNRILSDAEVAEICRQNGVEPMQRQGGPIDLASHGIGDQVREKVSSWRSIPGQLSLGDIESAMAQNPALNQTKQQNKLAADAVQTLTKLTNADTGKPVDRGVALTITKELLESGKTELVGKRVKNADDLAALAQVYRDPRFETLRYFFADADGNLVFQTAVSSGVPNASLTIPSGENYNEYLDRLSNAAKKQGATTVYMLHNHPSGNVSPSREDMTATGSLYHSFKQRGLNLSGSIVIDHTQYALLSDITDTTLTPSIKQLPKNAVNDLSDVFTPAKRHAILGTKVTSASDLEYIAKAEKAAEDSDDLVSLIFSDSKGHVRVIQKCGVEFANDRAALTEHVRKVASGYGCPQAFAVTRNADAYNGILRSLYSDSGVFTDVLLMSGGSLNDRADPSFRDMLSEFGKPGGNYDEFMGKKIEGFREGSMKFSSELVPTFYSKLQREVEGYKGDKIGASSVESYLKSRGVKDEEIKWSGIRQYLEGKKSVSKKELAEYLKNNEMVVETRTLTENGYVTTGEEFYSPSHDRHFASLDQARAYAEELAERWDVSPKEIFMDEDHGEYTFGYVNEDGDEEELLTLEKMDSGDTENNVSGSARWGEYKLDGGSNYREILFVNPKSAYTNRAMTTHWGEDNPGVLAHARVQDFDSPAGKVLFVEEIQSDWHNQGRKGGYIGEGESTNELRQRREELIARQNEIVKELGTLKVEFDPHAALMGTESPEQKKLTELSNELSKNSEELVSINDKLRNVGRQLLNGQKAPDAPFRDTYTNFALKNLLRMAAEGDYDYLAWTTGKMQEDRWSDDYAEGYRIEYDQEIPKFLRKYGKQWNAGLTNIALTERAPENVGEMMKGRMRELYQVFRDYDPDMSYSEFVYGGGHLLDEVSGMDFDDQAAKDRAVQLADELDYAFDNELVTYDDLLGNTPTTDVPAIAITDAMKDSVLHEGQPMYSTELRPDPKMLDRAVRELHHIRNIRNIEEVEKRNDRLASLNMAFNDALTALPDNPVTKHQTYQIANKYLAGGSDALKKEVRSNIAQLYELMGQATKVNARQLTEAAVTIAEKIVSNADRYERSSEMKDMSARLKKTKFYISPELKKEIEYNYGSYVEFRRKYARFMGMTLDRSKATDTVDSFYEGVSGSAGGMAGVHREWFPADITNEADQLIQIADVAKLTATGEKLTEDYGADYEEIVYTMAQEILADYFRANGNDKYMQKVNAIKQELREEYEARLDFAAMQYKDQLSKKDADLAKKQAQFLAYKDEQRNRRFDKAMRDKLWQRIRTLRKMKGDENFNREKAEIFSEISAVRRGALSPATVARLNELASSDEVNNPLNPLYTVKHHLAALREIEELDRKHVGDMTAEEVASYLNAVTELIHYQRTQNRLLDESKGKYVSRKGRTLIRQQDEVSERKMNRWLEAYRINSLAPIRALPLFDGYVPDGVMAEYAKKFFDGDMKSQKYMMDAEKSFSEWLEDEKYMRDLTRYDIELTNSAGRKVKVSRDMAIAMYLAGRDAGNVMHTEAGGWLIPNEKLYRGGKRSESYYDPTDFVMKQQDYAQLDRILTDKDKRFADAISKYFNDTSKKAMNEVSRKLYGYDIAMVDNYFPITVDKSLIIRDIDVYNDPTLESSGFTKERTKSTLPIYLDGVTNVLKRSINNVGRYYGMAVPLRDFNSVYNFTAYDDPFDPGRRLVSGKKAFEHAWRTPGKEYLENLMSDLNRGSRERQKDLLDYVYAGYGSAVLGANVRVMLSQASSYPMALTILHPDSLAKGLAASNRSVDMDYIDSITPSMYMRRKGMTGTELGEMYSARQRLREKPVAGAILKSLDVLTGGIQRVDVWTTTHLVSACKAEIETYYPDLKPGTKAYDNKLADLIEQVNSRTQPSYGIMNRNEYSKRSGAGWKILTMFKTQVFNMYGELYDAMGRDAAYRKLYKDGKVTRSQANKARTDAAAALLAVLLSQLLFELMKKAVDLSVYHNPGDTRDEAGEVTAVSVAERVMKDTMKDLIGMAPGADIAINQTAVPLVKNALSGRETIYDIDAPGLGTVNDIRSAADSLAKASAAYRADPSEKNRAALQKKAAQFVIKASYLGYPLQNSYNTLNGLWMNWNYKPFNYDQGEGLWGLKDNSPSSEQYANMAIRSFANGNEERGSFAVGHTTTTKLEDVLGAEASRKEDGSAKQGSKAANAMQKINDLDMSDEAKINLIEAMYPKLDGMTPENLDDYIGVRAAKAEGGQDAVIEYLKGSDLSEESKLTLWEMAGEFSAKTYNQKMK